ncbi:MAG: Radical SAM superfamily enzyme [candidate division TM6 bacterium GW2011_GWF2_37_49]|nr:MAG: Radical SAM superfamily enzyme [candidate division TM6 bacterium GW2011_GWF2_37_49]
MFLGLGFADMVHCADTNPQSPAVGELKNPETKKSESGWFSRGFSRVGSFFSGMRSRVASAVSSGYSYTKSFFYFVGNKIAELRAKVAEGWRRPKPAVAEHLELPAPTPEPVPALIPGKQPETHVANPVKEPAFKLVYNTVDLPAPKPAPDFTPVPEPAPDLTPVAAKPAPAPVPAKPAPAPVHAAAADAAKGGKMQKSDEEKFSEISKDLKSKDYVDYTYALDLIDDNNFSKDLVIEAILASGKATIEIIYAFVDRRGVSLRKIWDLIKDKYRSPKNVQAFIGCVYSYYFDQLKEFLNEIVTNDMTAPAYIVAMNDAGVDRWLVFNVILKNNQETQDNIAALVGVGMNPTQLWLDYFLARKGASELRILNLLIDKRLDVDAKYEGDMPREYGPEAKTPLELAVDVVGKDHQITNRLREEKARKDAERQQAKIRAEQARKVSSSPAPVPTPVHAPVPDPVHAPVPAPAPAPVPTPETKPVHVHAAAADAAPTEEQKIPQNLTPAQATTKLFELLKANTATLAQVKALIAQGADVKTFDESEEAKTPIYYARLRRQSSDTVENNAIVEAISVKIAEKECKDEEIGLSDMIGGVGSVEAGNIDNYIEKLKFKPSQVLNALLEKEKADALNIDILVKKYKITEYEIIDLITHKFPTPQNVAAFVTYIANYNPDDLSNILRIIIENNLTGPDYIDVLIRAGVDQKLILTELLDQKKETTDNLTVLITAGMNPTQLWFDYFMKRKADSDLRILNFLIKMGLEVDAKYGPGAKTPLELAVCVVGGDHPITNRLRLETLDPQNTYDELIKNIPNVEYKDRNNVEYWKRIFYLWGLIQNIQTYDQCRFGFAVKSLMGLDFKIDPAAMETQQFWRAIQDAVQRYSNLLSPDKVGAGQAGLIETFNEMKNAIDRQTPEKYKPTTKKAAGPIVSKDTSKIEVTEASGAHQAAETIDHAPGSAKAGGTDWEDVD